MEDESSRCWGDQEMESNSSLLVLIITISFCKLPAYLAVMDCPYSVGRNSQGLNRDLQHQHFLGPDRNTNSWALLNLKLRALWVILMHANSWDPLAWAAVWVTELSLKDFTVYQSLSHSLGHFSLTSVPLVCEFPDSVKSFFPPLQSRILMCILKEIELLRIYYSQGVTF